MKKTKIFTIGGATFDIFVKPEDQAMITVEKAGSHDKWLSLAYGKKVRITEVIEAFGGGAANTAVAFARMELDAYFVGKVGADYGDRVLSNMEAENVHTYYASKTTKDKTGFSTIINALDGDRTVLGYGGANNLFGAGDLPMEALKEADFIFLNHISGNSEAVMKALVKFMDQNPHIKLAWNPGHEQLVAGAKKWKKLLKHTDILFVNKEEAALFSGKPYEIAGAKHEKTTCHVHAPQAFLPTYADDVTEIFLELFKYGPKNVVITDGRNGAQASDGKNLYFCPVVSTKRVDTLGAGDAFASGFTTAFIKGEDLKSSLIYGTLNANSVVSRYGAQAGLLGFKALQAKLKKSHFCVLKTALTKTH